MNVFESSAAELQKLNERVLELSRRRREGPETTAAWREAAQTFHANYDRLAFPGGLVREFERLRNGDPEAIDLAVQYLEANPWYFRSGYYKADILKFLKRLPLTQEQSTRLRKVILDRVRGKPVREMRAYGRLHNRLSPLPEYDLPVTGGALRYAASRTKLKPTEWIVVRHLFTSFGAGQSRRLSPHS